MSDSDEAPKNCTPDYRFPTEHVARILLITNAKHVSDILKENPLDRNEQLINLLRRIFSQNEQILSNIFSINPEPLQNDTDARFKLHLLGEPELTNLALHLSDFLSLKTDREFRESYEIEAGSVEGEIKKLLYLNPAGIDDAVANLTGNSKRIVENLQIGCSRGIGDDEDGRRNNRSGLAVKIDGQGVGDGRNSSGGIKGVELNGDGEGSHRFETVGTADVGDAATNKPEEEINVVERDRNGDKDERHSASRGLQFLDVPEGDGMRIHDLKLDDENAIFSIFSMLVGYLQPDEFPLGLIKDIFQRDTSSHVAVLQILKLEGLVLCWIVFWLILALCLPCAVVAQMCCPRKSIQRLRDDASSVSSNLNNKCTGKAAGFLLYILMVSLLNTILLMLAANDKFSRTIERSPDTVSVAFKDVETFIKNVQLQTSFVASSSFEITVEQISSDLENIERLLGNPFKRDFMRETGFNQIIEELTELKTGSTKISKRVRELLRECNAAKGAGKLLRESLSELSRQLNLARRYCAQTDRSLCESLQSTGLDLAFTVDELLADPYLQYLEQLSYDDKFNSSIDETVKMLNDLPKHVATETASQKAAILDVLQVRRRQMYSSVRSLEDLAKSVTLSVRTTGRDVSYLVESVSSRDLWRYLSVVAVSFLTFLAWVSYLCGSPCCCHYTRKTILYLKLGIFLTCFLTIALWVLGSISFLLGGHAQIIICNPLYQDRFIILSKILDENGLISKQGFFRDILKSNQSLKIEDILRSCQRDQPAYTTFHLENRIDIPKIFNYQSWDDLQIIFNEFQFPTDNLKIFADDLETNLERYSQAASRNRFRDIRSKISFPITYKDLGTFHDQLYTVGKQISDKKSAGNFEKIAVKMEEIIKNELKSVENYRDSILYAIFLEDHGQILAEKNVKIYIFRLERHLHDLQKYFSEQIRDKIGRCKPIWDVFHHLREHICKSAIEPLNALSFSYFTSVFIFLCLTPIIINLIGYYKEISVNFSGSSSNGNFEQELSMRDQGVWTSHPSRSTSISIHNLPVLIPPLNDETIWTSPTSPGSLASFPREVPVPPRPPSIASIRSAPRLAGLYTIKKAKAIRSKYDSLKLIERTWKSPRSTQSPRGWL
ncbi:Prominin [Popillia japonica]|uniref:Prominin n=1 Tax=Popillia japonica TaxID=7064 RepID=A0AAW1I944_POPJA